MILPTNSDALGISGLAARGMGDLAIDDRKVSGSAQRRGRRTLLHHGTFLYALDIRSVERYLKEPSHQPAYRRGRSHSAFLMNAPVVPDAVKAAFTNAWDAAP